MDSITLNGQPFAVLLPDAQHKYPGVRITMLGDFSAEKEHVLKERNVTAPGCLEGRQSPILPEKRTNSCDGSVRCIPI